MKLCPSSDTQSHCRWDEGDQCVLTVIPNRTVLLSSAGKWVDGNCSLSGVLMAQCVLEPVACMPLTNMLEVSKELGELKPVEMHQVFMPMFCV